MRQVPKTAKFQNLVRGSLPGSVRGFSLVEVMVALLVLSMGLAGLAALLTTGVRVTGTANLQSVAITHSQTGVEMMRANLTAYTAGWYAGGNTSGAAPAQQVCAGAGGCTGDAQASNDYATWRERIAASMPDGQGFICVDSTPDDGQPGALACDGNGNNVTKIFWLDSRDQETLENGDTHHRFATVVNP